MAVVLAVGWCLALSAGKTRAQSQAGVTSERELDLGRVIEATIKLLASLTEKTQEGLLTFIEQLELLDVETEIDRLVGSPWELNDSTTYKLSLLPYNISFPIYRQVVQQMTRQDNLRSRRIHRVSPDEVDVIALRLDLLERDELELLPSGEVQRSLLTHFNAREMIDLGFFVMSQQPVFPEDEAGWTVLKRRMAKGSLILAGSAVATGALFNAGAFAQSGRIVRSKDRSLALGWYGGFRRLGFAWRPQLRAGLTGTLPGFELAAGLSERIRPASADAQRAIELAVREGWLNRLTAPQGWDAFFEGAYRQVIAHGDAFEGERSTGRVGFFFKRDHIPFLPNFLLRGSSEVESDLAREARYALGLGLEHESTGLSTVVQMSRSRVLQGDQRPRDTRVGIFFAGTIDPPTQHFADRMVVRARAVRETWDELLQIESRRASWEEKLKAVVGGPPGGPVPRAALLEFEQAGADRERHLMQLSSQVADYLESRRLAYNVLRRARPQDGLHGPLDNGILNRASQVVLARLSEVAQELNEIPTGVDRLRRRQFEVHAILRVLAQDDAPVTERLRYQNELDSLGAALRRLSVRARERLTLYEHHLSCARRIATAWGGAAAPQTPRPVEPAVLRSLLALQIRTPPVSANAVR